MDLPSKGHNYTITPVTFASYEFTIGPTLSYGGYFRILEDVRIDALQIGMKKVKYPPHLIFVVRANHVVIHDSQNVQWKTEYRALSKVSYVGNSSLQLTHYVGEPSEKNPGLKSVLFEAVTTCVVMDIRTGKAATLPLEMLGNLTLDENAKSESNRKKFDMYPIAKMLNPIIYQHPLFIGPSHIDSFGHTNQSRYIDMFYDALYYASIEEDHPIQPYAQQLIRHTFTISVEYVREMKCGLKTVINTSPVHKNNTFIGITFEAILKDQVGCRGLFKLRSSKM